MQKNNFHCVRIEKTKELILQHLDRNPRLGQNILDIGCGDCRLLNEIVVTHPDNNYYALDISEEVFKHCDSKIKTICIDINDYTDETKKYDVIVLNNIFEHFFNPIEILRKIHRILNDNGIVVLTTPNRFHLQNVLRILSGKRQQISPVHFIEYTISQVIELSTFSGFSKINIYNPKINYANKSLLWRMGYVITGTLFRTFIKIVKGKNMFYPVAVYELKK